MPWSTRNASLLLIALVACDADPAAGTDICAEANAAVEMCLGVPAEAPSNSCDADQAEVAQELLDGIEAAGCEGVPVGKDDSFLCAALLWDPLGWCDDTPEPLGPEPAGEPTRYPIILAHGFNTSTTNFWRFNDVDVALIEDGHDVVLGSVPPFDTPQVRAEFLARQVDELLESSGSEKVNMVCFSMGGIDCRYLVSPDGLGYGEKVASVTTISSPHRGTYVADVAVGFLPDEEAGLSVVGRESFESKRVDDAHVVVFLRCCMVRKDVVSY